jgi:hypothetical protein
MIMATVALCQRHFIEGTKQNTNICRRNIVSPIDRLPIGDFPARLPCLFGSAHDSNHHFPNQKQRPAFLRAFLKMKNDMGKIASKAKKHGHYLRIFLDRRNLRSDPHAISSKRICGEYQIDGKHGFNASGSLSEIGSGL